MKVAHLSDLHFCANYLTEVERCTGAAIDAAIEAKCDVIAITGDATDHHLDAHSPAFLALAKQIRRAADAAPVIVLQGTFSHDVPGTVSLFRLLGGRYPIHVSDRIEQVAWDGQRWIVSEDYRFDTIPPEAQAVFTSIPAVNHADIAVRVGVGTEAPSAGELVQELLASFATPNREARAKGIPTVLLSHGTVSGSITEHGVPMAGLDHEYTTGALFGAEASAVMLGHIHRSQSWVEGDGRMIAYAGSIGRLHYGERGTKCWLEWVVSPQSAMVAERPTPARRMVEYDFQGPPDLVALAARKDEWQGAFVRLRYEIDEEHRHSVSRKDLLALFDGALEVKIEGRVNPVLRSRTTGIAKLDHLPDQLLKWAESTATPSAGLVDRLRWLDTQTPEEIVKALTRPDANRKALDKEAA